MSRILAAALALGLFAIAGAASAAPAGTLEGLVGALDRALDRALGGRARAARNDIALVVRAAGGAPPELAAAIRRLLAARVARKGFRSQAIWPASLARGGAEARARAEGYELLLDGTVALVGGQLHLRAELVATDALIWRDVRYPGSGAIAHLHASVRADAEVRAFGGGAPPPAMAFVEQRVAFGARRVLAAAAADLDGDGLTELVVLHPGAVAVLRVSNAQPRGIEAVTTFSLPPPLAAWSPRRTVGTLRIADLDGDGRPELLARSSRVAQAVILAYDGKALVARGSWPEFPLLTGVGAGGLAGVRGAALEAGRDTFAGATFGAAPGRPEKAAPGLPARFYALQAAVVSERGGGARGYAALVDDAGRLSLRDEALLRELAALPAVGLAFDLVDLEDDGELDLVTTEPSSEGEPDGLTVYRLRAGKLRPRWRSTKIDGRIVAVTHGVLDSSGRRALIAVLVEPKGKLSLLLVS